MTTTAPAQTATETRCLRCGRKLKNGGVYGRVCARKIREAAIAEARADYSEAQQAKADELIRDGGIVLQAPGLYEAVSSKGEQRYATDGNGCTCHAGVKDRRCYHLLAARILTIASRRSLARAA